MTLPARRLAFYLAFLLACAAAGTVFAHGTGGYFEKEVDGYLIDIGYSPTSFAANEPIRFDFNLLDASTNEGADFTDIWVRVARDEGTVFATAVALPGFGGAGMIFTFPTAGTYELHTRFERGDEKIVETSFPVTVSGATQDASASENNYWILIAAGAIAAALLFFHFIKKRAS